ncbi:MAG: DoxX family protein [Planctomycetaceae bacterium]
MVDIRRYSLTAVVLLVVLRVGIGWQLLYEGMWKIDTLSTQSPWSSDGYLKSAQGPFRGLFRAMAGDPDDKSWLNPDAVAARWDKFNQRFSSHYKLSDGQKSQFTRLIDGASSYDALLALEKLPEGVDFAALKLDKTISFDAASKRLKIDGHRRMTASEKASLEAQVADRTGGDYDLYRKALDEAFTRASRLSYKERMRAHLVGDPDNAGLVDGRISQIELYNEMVKRYEDRLASAKLTFEQDHLNRIWSDARAKGRDLAGPVIAMDKELQEEALKIPEVSQLARGPLSPPLSPVRVVDLLTIAGLAGLGILLIVGLFSRFAAFSAAFMVFGFYLAMPPLPGVADAPGPEHSFIVNKNLIEVFALLALAAVPTGYWFGLDKLVAGFFYKRKSAKAVAKK